VPPFLLDDRTSRWSSGSWLSEGSVNLDEAFLA
jgi:hypothetical protein